VKVYLDYAATSPIKPEVRKAIEPFLNEDFGNPSSIHSWGQKARGAVDIARAQVAKFLNADPSEIIFTSGGTEADNLALRGIINYQKPHIITSMIEHHAVLKTCEHLEKEGLAEVIYLKPNREGIIRVEQVERAIKKDTVLVSVAYINNEIGTIAPIREIGKMIEKENKNRKQKIYFHTDAVQAAGNFSMDVDFLHVDMLTISGHKIGAPKGIGALYVRKIVPIRKIIFGGEQEMNFRAGTENVVGMVALGKAVELIENRESRSTKMTKLRDYFIDKVLQEIPEVELNGSKKLRSPNNANFYFKYIEGESILLNLDLAGIAASSGSACTSQSLEPSHVMLAVFGNPERAHGSIRFTLGENSTKAEIDYTILNLKKIVKKLRAMSPLYPSTTLGASKGK
jgi:cysteine desulfurase